jgi:ribosomal protein S18 acetylase RimI-like enzyme
MTMLTMTPQPFDSGILGGPVYRAEVTEVGQIPLLESSVPADAVLVTARVRPDWVGVMAMTRFREIERLVSFERPLSASEGGPLPDGVRLANSNDAEACADIAGRCFSFDRYHVDPEIDNAAADESKRAWARNNLMGRGDAGFLAEFRGEVVAFNLCLRDADWALIDLIAVAPEAQGLGLGKTLVKAAIHHYAGIVPVLRVGTQTTNEASKSIYSANGFTRSSEMVTFHWTPANQNPADQTSDRRSQVANEEFP